MAAIFHKNMPRTKLRATEFNNKCSKKTVVKQKWTDKAK